MKISPLRILLFFVLLIGFAAVLVLGIRNGDMIMMQMESGTL
jgi:hypothetical protein